MHNKYGYAGPDWEKAKVQATKVLIDVARRKGRIAYSELAAQITAIQIEAHDPRMFHLLGEISTAEDKAGRGMLTAIVVHKSGDMQPGPGFFELAKSLGKDTSDVLVCWINEFNKVHDYWANKAKST
jgi:hypothetical protein